MPLYTRPSEPLSDDEIKKAIAPFCEGISVDLIFEHSIDEYRAVEQAHGIGVKE